MAFEFLSITPINKGDRQVAEIMIRQTNPFATITGIQDPYEGETNPEKLVDIALESFFLANYKERAQKEVNEKLDNKINTVEKSVQTKIEEVSKEAEKKITKAEEASNKEIKEVKNALEETKTIVAKQNEDLKGLIGIIYSGSLTDEQRESINSIYPTWEVDTAYTEGDVVNYDNSLYKVVQAHTSQEDWKPTDTPAIYTPYLNVNVDTEEGNVEIISDFTQPTGAHDAYAKGTKVVFNGSVYESTIDSNVYSPTDYPQGWTLVEGNSTDVPVEEPVEDTTVEEPVEEPVEETTTVPEFKQPTGAHDAYSLGDLVLYNGSTYESTIANNVYSPDAYPQGWTKL
ncbi:hypothetical protein AVP_94 [Aerococcus phage vB_AviM_AVP]|nr:hypothetical protein AVP_94 [Aerococcus phage vB_AviM_AVP]